jgi:hypothetical protein
MATIVTRITGATAVNRPLTNTELDNNFINLNSAIPTNLNQLTNGPGYITGITSANVTTALGFTPYNATNPNGYITSSGNAATATTATNQSGGTVAATTGSFSQNITVGIGTAVDPSSVGGFAAGQITEGSTGFSAPGIVIGASSGQHGAIVYGAGTMYFGTETGSDNTLTTRATLSSGGAFNTIGAITQNGSQVLTAGNYNSYAPTLTGTGASGSWGINITGNAATATSASQIDGIEFRNGDSSNTINPDSINNNGTGYVNSVSLFGQTDGALYSQAFSTSWVHQIFGDYRTGQLAVRGRNSGTLTAWRTVLDSVNYNSYAPTLTGTGASGNWGINITGNAATATSANALNTGNSYTGTAFTASTATAYIIANRTSSGSGQVGYNWAQGGTNLWWSYVDTGATRLNWYNSVVSTDVMTLTTSGALTISGDVRAPIFYDSNDTNYYCDPASTSNFLRTVINNVLTFGPDKHYYLGRLSATGAQAVRYEVARLFIDFNDWHEAGTFFVELQSAYYAGGDWQRWAINYDYNVGTCYLIEGVSPNGRFAQVTVGSPVQISGDFYYLPVYVSVRYYGNYYTYVKTSWPLNSSSTATSGGSVWVFTSPSGTNISDFTPASAVFTNNILSTSADVRAPIFYDNNDTNYYLDPASGSNLNGTLVNNGGTAMSGGWNRNLMLSSTYPVLVFNSANAKYSGIGSDHSSPDYAMAFWINGTSSDVPGTAAYAMRINSSNYVTALGSFRAPIFYDSNDTNYYFDPASTSKWNVSSQPGWHTFENYGTGITGTYESTRLQTVFAMGAAYRMADNGSTTNNMYGLAWSHPNAGSLGGANNLNDHGLLIINNGSFRAAISSRAVFSADVRGTLFYDYNDTNYYCDPNGVTNIAHLRINGNWDTYAHPYISAVTIRGTYPSIQFRSTGANTMWLYHMANDGAIHHYYSADGVDSYNWSIKHSMFPSGVFVSTGSMRTPIFYDSDNTGYYLDPASSTTSLRTGGDWRSDAATWTGEFAGKIQYHSSHWYIQAATGFIFRNSSGTNVMNCDSSGNVTFNANVTAYSDRNKKTNIATLTTAQQYFDKIDAKTFDWKSSGKQDIGFIAQDVEAAGLEMFVQNNEVLDPNTNEVTETVKSLDYGRMVAVLWQTVKELKQELAELKAK